MDLVYSVFGRGTQTHGSENELPSGKSSKKARFETKTDSDGWVVVDKHETEFHRHLTSCFSTGSGGDF